jgi:hypothetical protein
MFRSSGKRSHIHCAGLSCKALNFSLLRISILREFIYCFYRFFLGESYPSVTSFLNAFIIKMSILCQMLLLLLLIGLSFLSHSCGGLHEFIFNFEQVLNMWENPCGHDIYYFSDFLSWITSYFLENFCIYLYEKY